MYNIFTIPFYLEWVSRDAIGSPLHSFLLPEIVFSFPDRAQANFHRWVVFGDFVGEVCKNLFLWTTQEERIDRLLEELSWQNANLNGMRDLRVNATVR